MTQVSEAAVMYGSTPSRLSHKTDEIMKFVAGLGKACLHPFKALPIEYFENGCVGREKTICVCCKLIDVCEEFGIFGISVGCLIELEYHLELNTRLSIPQKLSVFIKDFDPTWQTYYHQLKDHYPKAIAALQPYLFP